MNILITFVRKNGKARTIATGRPIDKLTAAIGSSACVIQDTAKQSNTTMKGVYDVFNLELVRMLKEAHNERR